MTNLDMEIRNAKDASASGLADFLVAGCFGPSKDQLVLTTVKFAA